MNEKMKEFAKAMLNGEELITNRSWTADELINWFDCTVNDEGEIIAANGNKTGWWYEDIVRWQK